jgi:hypothetical protein
MHHEGCNAAEPQPKRKIKNLTTKDAKSTKFIVKNIRTLRVLRELRGEMGFLEWA